MKIAFYAPLKSPLHPVPSGDRTMARLLMQALALAGHEVTLVSEFRSFSRQPGGHPGMEADLVAERRRIEAEWAAHGRPDLWFTYHVYYKAPDFLGPGLSAAAGLPYVTLEASWSARRNGEGWSEAQSAVLDAINRADLNISMTARDQAGIAAGAPSAKTVRLPPFIDAGDLLERPLSGDVADRLVTVAMMRPGDKFESYRALAAALPLIDRPFHLDVIGDGPLREEVEAMLGAAAPEKVTCHGAAHRENLPDFLRRASVFVWPGVGEAYGMVYLEAAAAGLPVVAFRNGGVPEVVVDGKTGLLVPPRETAALSGAIRQLLDDARLRQTLGSAGRRMVRDERGLAQAAARLDSWLQDVIKGRKQ